MNKRGWPITDYPLFYFCIFIQFFCHKTEYLYILLDLLLLNSKINSERIKTCG